MGTLRQRGNGSWELVVSLGRDPVTGKYRRVVRNVKAKNKTEAKAALARLEVEAQSGGVGLEDPRIEELLDRWMQHLQAKGRSANTLYGYRRYIDREIVPVLGGTKLSKLTVADVDRLYDAMTARGLSPASVRQVHAVLRAALNQAEKWDLVRRNVARLASPPPMNQAEQVPPTVDELNRLLAAAQDHDPLFGIYVRVAAATGMRRAEACGLKWGDVDEGAGTLTIERSHVAVPGHRGDQGTKTRSTRVIHLDGATLDLLSQERRRRGALGGPEAYIFTDDGDQPWRPDSATARWARARKRAGVRSTIRLHDVRHWQATQLLDAGTPLPTVAARLGHATPATTLRIYSHRTEHADRAAADAIGEALADPNDSGPA